MKATLLALALALALPACDSLEPLEDSGCQDVVLDTPASGCTWGLAAGAKCESLAPKVDGAPAQPETFSVVCGSGDLVLVGDACSAGRAGVVTVSVCK